MTVSTLEEKIAEMQENAQEATQALQQLQAERVADGNGAISGEEAAAELEEISA